jgi:hypothetical protein
MGCLVGLAIADSVGHPLEFVDVASDSGRGESSWSLEAALAEPLPPNSMGSAVGMNTTLRARGGGGGVGAGPTPTPTCWLLELTLIRRSGMAVDRECIASVEWPTDAEEHEWARRANAALVEAMITRRCALPVLRAELSNALSGTAIPVLPQFQHLTFTDGELRAAVHDASVEASVQLTRARRALIMHSLPRVQYEASVDDGQLGAPGCRVVRYIVTLEPAAPGYNVQWLPGALATPSGRGAPHGVRCDPAVDLTRGMAVVPSGGGTDRVPGGRQPLPSLVEQEYMVPGVDVSIDTEGIGHIMDFQSEQGLHEHVHSSLARARFSTAYSFGEAASSVRFSPARGKVWITEHVNPQGDGRRVGSGSGHVGSGPVYWRCIDGRFEKVPEGRECEHFFPSDFEPLEEGFGEGGGDSVGFAGGGGGGARGVGGGDGGGEGTGGVGGGESGGIAASESTDIKDLITRSIKECGAYVPRERMRLWKGRGEWSLEHVVQVCIRHPVHPHRAVVIVDYCCEWRCVGEYNGRKIFWLLPSWPQWLQRLSPSAVYVFGSASEREIFGQMFGPQRVFDLQQVVPTPLWRWLGPLPAKLSEVLFFALEWAGACEAGVRGHIMHQHFGCWMPPCDYEWVIPVRDALWSRSIPSGVVLWSSGLLDEVTDLRSVALRESFVDAVREQQQRRLHGGVQEHRTFVCETALDGQYAPRHSGLRKLQLSRDGRFGYAVVDALATSLLAGCGGSGGGGGSGGDEGGGRNPLGKRKAAAVVGAVVSGTNEVS